MSLFWFNFVFFSINSGNINFISLYFIVKVVAAREFYRIYTIYIFVNRIDVNFIIYDALNCFVLLKNCFSFYCYFEFIYTFTNFILFKMKIIKMVVVFFTNIMTNKSIFCKLKNR